MNGAFSLWGQSLNRPRTRTPQASLTWQALTLQRRSSFFGLPAASSMPATGRACARPVRCGVTDAVDVCDVLWTVKTVQPL